MNQPMNNERKLYTALDVGTAYAKAIIIEVQDDVGVVLGVGRYQQSYSHMSEGIITDIPSVISSCNEAIIRAEQSAGGIIAPLAVIGVGGELVKGSSVTITKQRQSPAKPITSEELESMISSAQSKLLKNAKDRIAAEIGYPNIEVRLTNTAVISVRIDGRRVNNPIGFGGRHFTLTLFSAFAPLMQLIALEMVAQGLDLTLATITATPCALSGCLNSYVDSDSGAIFIDIGAGTTDIALVRQDGIEGIRMFALGGRTFTRRIAASKGVSLKEAEKIKLGYSTGAIRGTERDDIHNLLAPESETWMDSVELLIEELANNELLPPAIYLAGGSSALPDLRNKLETFPWIERLPFSRQPIIETIQPTKVTSISDPDHLLKNAQDITPMALAAVAIELESEKSVLRLTLEKTISTFSQSQSPLRIFLCHSSNDKVTVRDLYRRLQAEGFRPWLDEENLLPGQDWEHEIRKAVRATDVVIVCLSRGSIQKTGYVQKEIKFALDVADEQPEGTIFLIPLKLEECNIPERLRHWQWVNFFEEKGYERLIRALQARAKTLQI